MIWSPSTASPFFVDHDQPVGVAVERDADVGAFLDHLGLDRLERGRADAIVDVEPVGADADRDDLGAQLPDRGRSDLVGRAVGAVDHHLERVEADVVRQRLLDRVDVATARVLDPSRAADVAILRERDVAFHQPLDRFLVSVAELEAIGAEQLDAVVVVRVVAGRDHHPEVGAHLAGEQRDRRGRQRPGQYHVHSHAGEPGDERGLHHVARQAGVLADDHAMLVVTAQEVPPGGLANFHRGRRVEQPRVGAAADAVGAEIPACHRCPLRNLRPSRPIAMARRAANVTHRGGTMTTSGTADTRRPLSLPTGWTFARPGGGARSRLGSRRQPPNRVAAAGQPNRSAHCGCAPCR
jgi:hypothetical protein